MKNLLFVLIVLLGLQACKKDTFNYKTYAAEVGDIDSIYFSTGSTSLIADGKATLQFVLEAYRKVQIKDAGGQSRDTMMYVDYAKLPKAEVKIFADGQVIEGMEYKIADLSKNTREFYAQIGGLKSKVKSVQIKAPKPLGAKRYIDVVFHVFELSTTDPGYDALTYQDIQQKQLESAIAYANAVFNNVYGKDPNGGQANFEFRLAKKNPAGTALALPGYNKILYDASWKASPTAQFIPANFTAKINATVAYQWNKDKFLNIYIYPTAANTNVGNNRAAYQLVAAGQQAIEGIANIVNSEAEIPTTDFYTTYGLGIQRSIFFPEPNLKIEIAPHLGIYYGLYATNGITLPINDFVVDTKKYFTGNTQTANQSSGLLKTGLDGEKFLANNAMDDVRYASLRNCFTQGQIERMRLVMERCPVRKAWQSE